MDCTLGYRAQFDCRNVLWVWVRSLAVYTYRVFNRFGGDVWTSILTGCSIGLGGDVSPSILTRCSIGLGATFHRLYLQGVQ